jgi:tripartite ATP-independent transporter DctM subunit
MDATAAAIICVSIMLIMLLIGIPIPFALGFSSILIGTITYGATILEKVGSTTFYLVYNFVWTPLPLFTLMACIMAETRIGEDLYRAARNWLSRLPGGLISASILGEAGMAAALGASAPTIIAVGKVAAPEFERYGYNKGFSIGALACGGVLGPLIPPSATMIIYSVLTNVSLGRLFIAGIIPGIILALLLGALPIILCTRNPSLGPVGDSVSWAERFGSLKKIWAVALIFVFILGSIYLGIATPTEAGGIGAFIVLVIAVIFYHLRWKNLYQAMVEAALINAMLMFIFVGAQFFSYVIGTSSLAENMTSFVVNANLPPYLVIGIIMVLLLVLGCFIEGITLLMLTIPIFLPLVMALGFDPLWFGILYVTNMEMGLITPPMGINLFLARNTFNVPTGELLKGIAPFFVVLLLFLAIIAAFPQLSLWLPSLMVGR